MTTTTEKATHTPGPWRVSPYYRHEVVTDSGVICCARIETEQTRANARLIAAAPEMLEVLETISATIHDPNVTWETGLHKSVKALIRKARGAE